MKELKRQIEEKTLPDDFQFWSLTDKTSKFISDQYIKLISEFKGLEIKIIESLDEVQQMGFYVEPILHVMYTDEFKDDRRPNNTIVILNKPDSRTKIFPALEDWQLVDYFLAKVNVPEYEIKYLVIKYKDNLFELDNLLDKVAIFESTVQYSVFNEMHDNGEFLSSSDATMNDFVTAISTKNIPMTLDILKVKDVIDLEPFMFVLSSLLRQFRLILNIQLDKKATWESSGCVSDKQFYFLKKNRINFYTDKQMVYIYSMLTKIEKMFMVDGLPTNLITDFLICYILGGV